MLQSRNLKEQTENIPYSLPHIPNSFQADLESWKKFPKTGMPFGPGGSFWFLLRPRRLLAQTRKTPERIAKVKELVCNCLRSNITRREFTRHGGSSISFEYLVHPTDWLGPGSSQVGKNMVGMVQVLSQIRRIRQIIPCNRPSSPSDKSGRT
jgi:hypothetical protein